MLVGWTSKAQACATINDVALATLRGREAEFTGKQRDFPRRHADAMTVTTTTRTGTRQREIISRGQGIHMLKIRQEVALLRSVWLFSWP